MKLSPSQANQVLNALQKHPLQGACPLCKGETWMVHETVFMIQEYSYPDPDPQGLTMPLIIVMCQTCGNNRIFNALKLGIAVQSSEGDGSQLPQ